ncbi:MAG TPA: rubrerythrin family protein [Lachnospiraceae bacterium]|nr:rubrerythrin family protein [Lachnospiraceae bacterium]
MAVDFKDSVTKENLMRAFAGESQARNRYTIAASEAKKQGLHVIEAIFKFTADQEKEHAEIFYNHLSSLASQNIHIDGAYPIDISQDVAKLLRFAQRNEYEEHDDVYKNFGDKAKEEGFQGVAASFQMIAEIEKSHGNRFGMFADMLEQNQLFVSNIETSWMCLNCGYIYKGTSVPDACPVCHHDKGYFIRLELAPYTATFTH